MEIDTLTEGVLGKGLGPVYRVWAVRAACRASTDVLGPSGPSGPSRGKGRTSAAADAIHFSVMLARWAECLLLLLSVCYRQPCSAYDRSDVLQRP